MAATSCWSMPSAAAAPISSRDSSADSGCSWIVIAGIGGTPSAAEKPPSTARRVTQINQGLPETWVPRWRSSSDDASSIQCASSTTSKVGFRRRSDSSFSITPWSRARRNAGCSSSTSCVGSTATSSTRAISGSQGSSSGSRRSICEPKGLARGLVGGQVEQSAQGPAEREIRSRGLVLLANGGEAHEVGCALLQLGDEARLAQARLADQLDHVPEAHAHGAERRGDDRQLALTADERNALLGDRRARPWRPCAGRKP